VSERDKEKEVSFGGRYCGLLVSQMRFIVNLLSVPKAHIKCFGPVTHLEKA